MRGDMGSRWFVSWVSYSELMIVYVFFFFFKQKTAYEIRLSLVGSEMCIRDRFFEGVR